jgi:hypothetical protein
VETEIYVQPNIQRYPTPAGVARERPRVSRNIMRAPESGDPKGNHRRAPTGGERKCRTNLNSILTPTGLLMEAVLPPKAAAGG